MSEDQEHEVNISIDDLSEEGEVESLSLMCSCNWNKPAETIELARSYAERHLLHNKLWPYDKDERPDDGWPN